MITKLTTISELQALYNEMLLNHTNKISKVSKGSVVSGHGLGVAKISQKAVKDVALIEVNLFPKESFGSHLDNIAENWGISPRYESSGSSTYVLLIGEVGTEYTKAVNTFTGSHGIEFELAEDTITIPDEGFIYANVHSKTSGSNTSIESLTMTICNSAPAGHDYVINEYKSVGGRDEEQDSQFRSRIMNGANIAATGTIAMLTQVLMKINNDVLKVKFYGLNNLNKIVLGVLAQNGADFTQADFDEMLNLGEEYFNLEDMRRYGESSYGIELVNIDWEYVDLDFRAGISDSYSADDVRIAIQIQMSKYLDFRYWSPTDKVEWDDLLSIAKNASGVEYVPDNHFYPKADIKIERTKLPRIRGFIMRDLEGNIITNSGGNPSSVYFPSEPNESFQTTIISSI